MNSSPDVPKPKQSVSVNYVFVAALITAIVVLGYWLRPEKPVLSEWIGQNIQIQFRRDALGAASNLPISPDTGEINGASTSIIGRLVSVSDSEIVMMRSRGKREARPHWIPREAILFIEVNL